MFTTRPELTGTHGMVASTHWLASAAGMAVLERGGNAVDAAVTAGFVLQVVEPHLNGPGGDVPVLVASPGGPVEVYCGQGVTPAAASAAAYRDLGLDLVPGSGPLAAVVPGAFGAWTLLLEQRGTWTLRDVLEPAIGYARDGFPLLPATALTIRTVARLFQESWPSSASAWLPGGEVPVAGSRVRSPVLATTYARLVREAEAAGSDREAQLRAARDASYRGFVAEELAAFNAQPLMDSSGTPHAGLLTADDLAAWQPTVEPAVSVEHAGVEVHKTAAWGQGPVLLQQLQLLAGFDLRAMGVLSAEWVHTVVECAKLAFADREAWYGDGPDVPLTTLLSRAYADGRRALVGDTASYDLWPGAPDGRTPRLPAFATGGARAAVTADGSGEPTVLDTGPSGRTRGDTCHVDVVDAAGTMVSATPSGGWLQSSPTVPSLGFCLGSRAQMLWLEDGLPSTMTGGVRPRTTLSPTMVTRDGVPHLALGTPGGDQQDQWQLAFLLAHLHGGLGLQEAIDAPMFHSAHFPSSFAPRAALPGRLVAEGRLGADVLRELARRGHDVEVSGDWSLGRLSAVGRDPVTGFLHGAANPRGMQGYAVGR